MNLLPKIYRIAKALLPLPLPPLSPRPPLPPPPPPHRHHHCHNDADLLVDESAEVHHGDGEVGDADPPVSVESAEENSTVLSKYFNWIIEGVEDLDEGKIRHMNAFYALLKKWMRGKAT